MAQFRFGPKNSKKFLQYLLTIRSHFHPKRTPYSPWAPLKKWKLHRFYAVFLRKNPIKKIQKSTYIGFWGRWFRIWSPLTSIISDSSTFGGQNAKNKIKNIPKNTYIYKFLGTLNLKGFIQQLNDMMEVNGPRIRNQRSQKPIYVFFWIFWLGFFSKTLHRSGEVFIFLRGARGE